MAFSAGTTAVVVVVIAAFVLVSARSADVVPIAEIDVVKHPEVNITPAAVHVESLLSNGVRCARVRVSGLSRLKLGSYSSAHRVALVPSPEIHERSYRKIQICLHSNSSRGLCKCESDSWESIQTETWSSVISPYENRFIDVKFSDNLSGSVTVGVKGEFHKWRLLCLFIGIVLLLLAPIVSDWVPFYYSSSMAIGVCLVIIILLFQGMKLLPTGRKNALYSTICGLALGAGSFLLNRFSMFINSLLVNFGISQEMHNPVLVFFVVGIVLAGAGFGYWLVRKFVVAEDGTVDVGVAQFVKWALRIIAVTFIFQSTLDTPLAIAVLISFWGIYFSITSTNRHGLGDLTYFWNGSPWEWSSERVSRKKRAEFFSRSGYKSPNETLWRRAMRKPAWSNSPLKGEVSPYNRKVTGKPKEYYSTFHKTPNQKKYSEEEWKDFTEKSTRQAVSELTSSPEFTDWIIKHADKIQFKSEDSSDDSVGSGSASTDVNVAESSSGRASLRRRW